MMSPRLLVVTAAALFAAGGRAASIRNSPHDLSSTSAKPGAKASTENQICEFCHTPHRALRNIPLWNHNETTQTFTFYTSYYTNSYLNIPPPTNAALAGTRTKMCLSCHDGVTALGSVYNLNGSAWTNPLANNIAMTGAISATANLGTNLADDHPVLYPVSAAQVDNEMQVPAASDPVKVYGAQNLVECTSCHDPHDNGQNSYGKFLVKSNANAAICTTCHVKSGWPVSIHATSAVAYAPGMGYPATTVGEWACRDCHRMHAAGGTGAYLNRGAAAGAGANPEENTCFLCHGTPPLTAGTKNIQSLLGYAARHPTITRFGVHRDPELSGTEYSVTPDRRHAECVDCHDPHAAQQGNRLTRLNLPTVPPSNLISGALVGGWGAEPTYGAAWTLPTYVRVTPTSAPAYTKEYQLCFKCHASYAYGGTPPGVDTDQGREFNPANVAKHPVYAAGNNPYCTTTSLGPPAVRTMEWPWNWAVNEHDTMMCSDCHGSDLATDPEGPHGSAQAAILQASLTAVAYPQWNNMQGTPLCLKCHSGSVYMGSLWARSRFSQHPGNNGDHRDGMNGILGGGPPYGCQICHGARTGALPGTPVPGRFHGENTTFPATTCGTAQLATPAYGFVTSPLILYYNRTTRRCLHGNCGNNNTCETY